MPKYYTTKQKSIFLIMSVVLVVAIGIGASLAYLTDRREADTTYTVGKVSVTLSGAGLGSEGDLYPGKRYQKEPIVTIGSNSEPCYVRLKVELPDELALVMSPLQASDAGDGWSFDKVSDTLYYFTYNNYLTNDSGQSSDKVTTVAFTRVAASSQKPEVPASYPESVRKMSHAELLDRANNTKMNIEVEAIQAGGFISASDAFAHFK